MSKQHFSPDMTVAEAMRIHPRAAEVFAQYRLGGCAHCMVGQVETIDQVCASYGIDSKEMIEALEGLFGADEQSEATAAS